MTKMIANKRLTYGTRRLVADEPFTARTSGEARLLNALGNARYVTSDAKAGDEPPVQPKPAPKPKTPRAPRKPKKA